MNEVTHVRGCADLALVNARVAMLRVLDLQGPVLTVWMVDGTKPLVTGVGVPPHRQQVDVTVSHPRHLK
jgi:hypothetical protein